MPIPMMLITIYVLIVIYQIMTSTTLARIENKLNILLKLNKSED